MAEQFEGTVSIARTGGDDTIALTGNTGNLTLGGGGQDGDIFITRSDGTRVAHLDGQAANLWLGGSGADGDIVLFPASATHHSSTDGGTIHLNADGHEIVLRAPEGPQVARLGADGNLTLGGGDQDGDLLVNRADGTRTFHLDGQGGNLWVGGSGVDGDIVLFPASATHATDTAEATIHLNADAGDIILRNADCAEDFDAAVPDIEPGSVVVIDDQGRLIPSSRAYDPRVAGIISGAGCYQPGLVLDRHPGIDNRVPLAMVGKAVCLADADARSIQVGDLLTTSDKTGRAMVATDRDRAFGSVIGKALAPLDGGQGSVPVLIGLQ